MTTRRRSSSVGILSPGRLGSTSSARKTESRTTSWLNDFTVERTIGRGKFAVVKKCVEKSTGRHFAAKCIRRRRHNRDCTPDILHEIAVLEISSLHPYLIDLYRVYETQSEVVLILEYAAGGEIFDHCVGVKDNFSEAMSRRLMLQILEGVEFLHRRDIVHLDLKPQNILLTKEGTEPDANIKLVDFGLSKYITNGLEIREILGTPDYVAPEVLNYEPISTATDIWSLGVVSYVMLTGVSPFLGDNKQETLMNVTTAQLEFPSDLFEKLSPACQDLIHKMLQRDPCDRMTAKDSLCHPWVSGVVAPCTPLTIMNESREASSSDEDVFDSLKTQLTNGHVVVDTPCNNVDKLEPQYTDKTSTQPPQIIVTECKDSNVDMNGNSLLLEKNLDSQEPSSEDQTSSQSGENTHVEEKEKPASELTQTETSDVFQSQSEVDFNGNIIPTPSIIPDESEHKENSDSFEATTMEKIDFLGQVKRRLSSDGDRMQNPGTCITGTNFADVMHQDPILLQNECVFEPTTTDSSLACLRGSCCLPCSNSTVYCTPVTLSGPRPETMTRRESDKENFDTRTCDKLAFQSKTLPEIKDQTPICSPRLTCLTLSSCTNSPNCPTIHQAPAFQPDPPSENVEESITPSLVKPFNITVRLPRCFVVPPLRSHSEDTSLLPSESIFLPSSSIKEPSSKTQAPDPSLKRRKFDFCSPKEQNATEIPVVD